MAVHTLESRTAGTVITIDRTGAFPVLVARRADGRVVPLNSRNPIADADTWLTKVLRGEDPPVIVLIGLGLGYVLDALEQRGSRATVLAIEPFAETLEHFDARRDWSHWIETGRLVILTGPDYDEGLFAMQALTLLEVPPVFVNPALASGFSSIVAGARNGFMRARFHTAIDPNLASVRQSMLHPAVLTTLEHFAASVSGVIVEIGAYVGGATMAMARGVRDSGRDTPIITIEPGGSHEKHAHLPSSDIFGDLQRNLRAQRLDSFVSLHHALSSDPQAIATVREVLAARHAQIGMLCIDADGLVQRDFDLYLPMCADGCVLVVDDYAPSDQHTKSDTAQAAVHKLMADGRATQLGVVGFGTWMGIYRS